VTSLFFNVNGTARDTDNYIMKNHHNQGFI